MRITHDVPADRNWNPHTPSTFPHQHLLPAVAHDFSDICARLHWSRSLEAHLPSTRVARAHTCRSNVLKLQIDTPFNSYQRYSPIRCNDPWVCPGCADADYQRRRDNWQNEHEAVLSAGVPIVGFSFLVTLPGWNEALRAAGCELSETRGRLCAPTVPCQACAGARAAHGQALDAENAVWEALRTALRASLPEHGGWHVRTLEPLDGLDGDITLRYSIYVPAAELRIDGLPSPLAAGAAPTLAHLQTAVEACLDDVGGTVRAAGTHTWQPDDGKSLLQVLDATFRPAPIRLASIVDNGVKPMPGTIARWARAWALSIPTRTGKTRRAVRSGKWGRLAGCMQADALKALLIERQFREIIPTRVTQLDRLRIVARNGATVTMQSYNTGALVAVHREEIAEETVDSQGNRGALKPPEWRAKIAPIPQPDAQHANARLSSITRPLTFALSDLRAQTRLTAAQATSAVAAMAWTQGIVAASPIAGQMRALDLVFGDALADGGWVEFRPIPLEGRPGRLWAESPQLTAVGYDTNRAAEPGRAPRLPMLEALAEMNRVNALGLQAYFGVNPRISTENGKNSNVAWSRVVYADFDVAKSGHDPRSGVATLLQAGLPPGLVVWTGNGAHVYLLLDTPIAAARSSALSKRLAAALKADNIGDDARVLRLPYTRNHKGAGSDAYIVSDSGVRLPVEAIEAWLDVVAPVPVEKPRPPRPRTHTPAVSDTMEGYIGALGPWYRDMIELDAPHPDDTSRAAVNLIGALLDVGADEDMITQIMEETEVFQWKHWTNAKHEPIPQFVAKLCKWHRRNGRGTVKIGD